MWTRRQWIGLAAGGLAAGLGAGHRGYGLWGPQGPGKARLWIADRALGRGPEGGAVLALDGDGLVASVRRMAPPVALAKGRSGLWVQVLAEGRAGGAQQLLQLGPGAVRRHDMRPGSGFALDGRGRPWLLEPQASRPSPYLGTAPGDDSDCGAQVLRRLGAEPILVTHGALRPLAWGTGLGLLNRAGELFRLDQGILERTDLGLAPLGWTVGVDGPHWVGRSPQGRIHWRRGREPARVLEGELADAVREAERTHDSNSFLQASFQEAVPIAAGPGGGAWLAPAGSAEVWRLDARGQVVVRAEVAGKALRLLPDGEGGVWILQTGALARLDSRGLRLPGQGGFGSCCDIISALRSERA